MFFETAQAALDQHRAGVAQSVEDYFTSLRAQFDRAREEIRVHHLRHADAFTVFDYIQPDENGLSDILADLLDPKGKRGQGNRFLHLFMQNLKVTLPSYVHQVKVHREEPTKYIHNSLRRIDILVDFGTFGLGIENKPWAEEQPDQVKDYLEHLRRQYGDSFLLAYLCGDGSAPLSVPATDLVRLEHANQFRLLAYPTGVRYWLELCMESCQADRVCWFLRDLGGYVKGNFRLEVANWRGQTNDGAK